MFWDELKRVCPALLLLDHDMPGASGVELCRMLRNEPRWAAVPILVLTARQDSKTLQKVFAAGADDYLVKPIVREELVARVQNRLERFRLHQALADTDALTGVVQPAHVGREPRPAAPPGPALRQAAVPRRARPRPLQVGQRPLRPRHRRRRAAPPGRGPAPQRPRRGRRRPLGRRGVRRSACTGSTARGRRRADHRAARGVPDEDCFMADGEALQPDASAPGSPSSRSTGRTSTPSTRPPTTPSTARRRRAATRSPAPPARHRTSQELVDVAVVEDDDATGDVVTSALVDRGHAVRRYSSGTEALDRPRRHVPRRPAERAAARRRVARRIDGFAVLDRCAPTVSCATPRC